MTYETLNNHYKLYLADHDYAHILFQACAGHAREVIRKSDHANPNLEDIVSEATWKAWSSWSSKPEQTPFAVWFTRVVKNQHRDTLRKQKSRERRESEDVFYPDPTFTYAEKEAIQNVTGECGELVSLLYQGHTFEESATILKISVRTARERLSRLKKEQKSNA